MSFNNSHKSSTYHIKTCDEWVQMADISNIIIDNKKNATGYLRFKGQLWRKLYKKQTSLDDIDDDTENLFDYIKLNQPTCYKLMSPTTDLLSGTEFWNLYPQIKDTHKYNHHVDYNVKKIFRDIINTQYKKEYEFYILKYHEYIIPNMIKSTTPYCILNTITFEFTPVDDLIYNKILTSSESSARSMYCKTNVSICCVDDILNSLLNNETKQKYKKLMYNIIVNQDTEPNIFYDYNNCLLTTWLTDLLYTISRNAGTRSNEYYENKKEFKKLLTPTKMKYVVIRNHKKISNIWVPIKTQINDFIKLGFKNIIVCQTDKTNNMYDLVNFRKYLQDNEEILKCCINQQYDINIDSWKSEIQHDDCIFYSQHLLILNFLKWCCVNC